MFALNFYSPLFIDQLRKGRKTATIRLGDKSHKYKQGLLVWVTVGHRHGPRQRIFTAIIDQIDVKPVRELTQREIERDNPIPPRGGHAPLPLAHLLREVTLDDTVSVIHFSEIIEYRPSSDAERRARLESRRARWQSLWHSHSSSAKEGEVRESAALGRPGGRPVHRG